MTITIKVTSTTADLITGILYGGVEMERAANDETVFFLDWPPTL